MDFDALKNKAAALPMVPGVYIMRDKSNAVIYVGKAKKLKNRVYQYFQNTSSHTPKTRQMVSKINDFDVVVAASEFEALVLENSLIKQYMPKYNILLKDDKGYPYLRLDKNRQYPKLSLANKVIDDGASYFGPFGSRSVTQNILESILSILKLPNCNKIFPRDIGKDRPCLHFHMKQCDGWCQEVDTCHDYQQRIEQARQLLQGNYKQVALQVKKEMLDAADVMNFELAASLRDRLHAIDSLGKKQLVTAGSAADTDVVGFYQNDVRACLAVLHFSSGNLVDKDYEIFHTVDDQSAILGNLIIQYYLNHGYAPRNILLPLAPDDKESVEKLLQQQLSNKTTLRVPQRGDKVRLVELANVNAKEEVERITTKEERTRGVLQQLEKMLNIPELNRIESYDISNISGTDMVGGMVVFEYGKPKKSAYKRFAIRDISDQNDYVAMEQVIVRRFNHYQKQDAGFMEKPDLLLIDGGIVHAQTVKDALDGMELSVPVLGMVKDDRHRTRALVTPEGEEIRIDVYPSVFSFIGTIQEEVHRFAISYHRNLRSKHLHYSELDAINGIGPKRKQDLLKTFKSLSAIKSATLEELQHVLPASAAQSVYRQFHQKEEGS